jgi:hypothetical protein
MPLRSREGLTTAGASQRVDFLDAKPIADVVHLVGNVPDQSKNVGRPACRLAAIRKIRLEVLLGSETVVSI